MSRREQFGQYTAVEGKLSSGDSRAAYLLGPTCSGRIAPIGSFWYYEDAVRRARELAKKAAVEPNGINSVRGHVDNCPCEVCHPEDPDAPPPPDLYAHSYQVCEDASLCPQHSSSADDPSPRRKALEHAMRRMKLEPNMVITSESHLDHGLTQEQIEYIKSVFGDRQEFFKETITLPVDLGTVETALVGPATGMGTVPESAVSYVPRSGRKWVSRVLAVPQTRPRVRTVTVIAGPDSGEPCVLYTAYGGPLAPREPGDPDIATQEELEESRAFWREHALIVDDVRSNPVSAHQDMTVDEFDKELQTGKYAWPGGYPKYFVTADGGALSFDAAKEEADQIRDAIRDNDNSGWRVIGVDINWEDPDLICDHTGERIESAYAEPEECLECGGVEEHDTRCPKGGSLYEPPAAAEPASEPTPRERALQHAMEAEARKKGLEPNMRVRKLRAIVQEHFDALMPKKLQDLARIATADLYGGPFSSTDVREQLGVSGYSYQKALKLLNDWWNENGGQVYVDLQSEEVLTSEPEGFEDPETGEIGEPFWDNYSTVSEREAKQIVFGALVTDGGM